MVNFSFGQPAGRVLKREEEIIVIDHIYIQKMTQ
jgi:hypothetical protein